MTDVLNSDVLDWVSCAISRKIRQCRRIRAKKRNMVGDVGVTRIFGHSLSFNYLSAQSRYCMKAQLGTKRGSCPDYPTLWANADIKLRYETQPRKGLGIMIRMASSRFLSGALSFLLSQLSQVLSSMCALVCRLTLLLSARRIYWIRVRAVALLPNLPDTEMSRGNPCPITSYTTWHIIHMGMDEFDPRSIRNLSRELYGYTDRSAIFQGTDAIDFYDKGRSSSATNAMLAPSKPSGDSQWLDALVSKMRENASQVAQMHHGFRFGTPVLLESIGYNV
ncbi:hypothetical protein BIW11_03617 [Tropilaelaps mercedesae]|uniref:Uncharacterized protein n=1 Tax=Tropilaelaps mercedesae TaxID=418985 RepID=A0A1V9XIE6_9ACAR|nr:hypothetical protein BIW11_03617 [Tropilaelaps mercedesae]